MRRAAVVAAAGLTVAAVGGLLAAASLRREPEERDDVSGAPFGLLSSRHRGLTVGEQAHVLPPAWEPGLLTTLARWDPSPPRSTAGRLAATSWAAPLTLLGLWAGLASGQRPRVHEGALLFTGVEGVAGPALRRRRVAAVVLGQAIVCSGEPSPALLAHELAHVRQAERLGPLFALAYLGLLAVYGYARHPLERAARRAGRGALSSERSGV